MNVLRRYPLEIGLGAIIVAMLVFGNAGGRFFALSLLLAFIAFYAAVFIHELGHLIAGFRVGYGFTIFSVGMLLIYQDEDTIRVTWRRLSLLSGKVLGFTLFAINDYTDFRRRMAWYVAAGPLANALTVIVLRMFIVPATIPDYALYSSAPLVWTLSIFGVCLFWFSLALLLMAIYPAEWVSTDGHKLLRLLRGGTILARYQAQIQIGNAILQGIRPREWDAAWIDPLTALKDESVDTVNAHALAYRWALDRGDAQQAEAYLTTAVKLRRHARPLERSNLLAEAAYVEIRYHANAENAQEWITRLGLEQNRALPSRRRRLASASSLSLRQYAKAREIAQTAIQVIDRRESKDGLAIMERDLLLDMIHLCDLADEMQAKRGTGQASAPPT